MSYSDDAFTLGRRVCTPLPSVFDGAVSGLDAAGAVARLRELTVQHNRLEAERSAVLTRLYEVRDEARMVREDSTRRFVDDWDELVAEVGAALGVGRGATAAAVHRALDLRERCPRVFRLHALGVVGLAAVREILRACAAVVDDAVAEEFDVRMARWLAARAGQSLPVRAIRDAADQILVQIDANAVREKPPADPVDRVEFHARADGMVDIEAVIPKADAIGLAAVIAELVQSVCPEDGRTLGQRQAAALTAAVLGFQTLGCRCGNEQCLRREARPRHGAISQNVKALAVIVLNESDLFAPSDVRSETPSAAETPAHPRADASGTEPQPTIFDPTDDADQDADEGVGSDHSEGADADVGSDAAPAAETPAADGDAAAPCASETGAMLLTGNPDITGPITAAQARALIDACTTDIRLLGRRDPTTGEIHLRGAGGYRPTWYQLLVMRLTYPHCVFPGCAVPADKCHADHVGEYDHDHPDHGGQTTVAGKNTPGNLVPLCGFHHRVKTETGWLSDILPDGTVEWRHPAGGIWTVPPGTAHEFLPGLETIIWDGPDPAVPGREQTKNPDGLRTDAQRRAQARRDLRTQNRILRHQRLDREAAEAIERTRELDRREAEAAGEDYDPTAPLTPPPF